VLLCVGIPQALCSVQDLILAEARANLCLQDQMAQTPSASSVLSPLAQRAADAAVRVAAGLLSPGRWKAPQAVGVSSIAALHNSASLPKNFAPYKYTYKTMSPAKVGVALQPAHCLASVLPPETFVPSAVAARLLALQH
jgi:hypothetical protein